MTKKYTIEFSKNLAKKQRNKKVHLKQKTATQKSSTTSTMATKII